MDPPQVAKDPLKLTDEERQAIRLEVASIKSRYLKSEEEVSHLVSESVKIRVLLKAAQSRRAWIWCQDEVAGPGLKSRIDALLDLIVDPEEKDSRFRHYWWEGIPYRRAKLFEIGIFGCQDKIYYKYTRIHDEAPLAWEGLRSSILTLDEAWTALIKKNSKEGSVQLVVSW